MQLTANLAYLFYCASIVAAAPIEARGSTSSYSGGTTASDVEQGVCAPITFIFARGSTETGTMGESVGPSVAKKLLAKVGKSGAAIQGVKYTASIASNASMGAGGGPVMAQLVKKAKQQCPSTKVYISGYSQGGSVVHYAMKHGGLTTSDVAGALVYGDPENGSAIGDLPKSDVKSFCASGDGVCELHTFAITAAHLSYSANGDTTQGADWIASNAGSSGASSSTGSTGSSDESGTASSGSGLSSLLSGGAGSADSSDSGDSSGSSDSSDSNDTGATGSNSSLSSVFGGSGSSKLSSMLDTSS